MRVILRDCETGQFYAGPCAWTDDALEAVDFQQTDRAMDAAYEARLSRVEVLMQFETPRFEIPLKICGFGKD